MNTINGEAGRQRSAAEAEARVRAMIKDLSVPLGAGTLLDTANQADERYSKARKVHNDAVYRQHESDLKRARNAAQKVFGVRRSRMKRKAATAMLAASAVGLAAFTSPTQVRPKPKHNMVAGYALQDGDLADENGRLPAHSLTVSDEFKQALMEEEGVRYIVYRDVAGYPTVGVGHLIDPGDNLRVGDRISDERVMQFLDDDLKEAQDGVRMLVGDLPLHQHEFDALVDLVFNVGIGNVSQRQSPRLNAAIQAGDYEGIANELHYHYAGGAKANGLVNRSERRTSIFLDASYDDPRETRSASVG